MYIDAVIHTANNPLMNERYSGNVNTAMCT